MSVHDPEWESLSASWSAASEGVDPAALRRLVERRRRRLLAVAVLEGMILLALVALSAFVLRGGLERWETVWLATLWSFAAIAVVFAWWNRRGTWAPIGDGVAEYARLSRLRCERQRRSLRFAVVLFAAEAAAVLGQLAWFDRLTPLAWALLGASAAAVAAWCLATARRLARELAAIQAFEHNSH